LEVQSLLPKVQHIQPWSAKSGGSSLPVKLDALVSRLSEPAVETDFADLQRDAALTAPEAADLAAPPMADTHPASTEFPNLTPVTSLAPAVESNAVEVEVPHPPIYLLNEDKEEEVPSTQPAHDLSDSFAPPAIPSVSDIIKTLIDPDAGTDAEATLWQDLARLVNGSTDEVPEASLGHDLGHEEHGIDAPNQATNWKSAIAPGPLPIPPLVPTATDKRKLLTIPFESSSWSSQLPQSGAIASEGSAAPNHPETVQLEQTGPSPVVYPERPAKKIQSLAAVDLPSFPR